MNKGHCSLRALGITRKNMFGVGYRDILLRKELVGSTCMFYGGKVTNGENLVAECGVYAHSNQS